MTADPLTSADAVIGGRETGRTAADEPTAPPRYADAPTVIQSVVPDAPTAVVRPTVLDAPTVAGPSVADQPVAGLAVVDAPTVIRPAFVDVPTVAVGEDSPTAILTAVPQPPPVFVDPSGRRRSRLRWIAYALGLVGLIYTGLVVASFAGGPVNADMVLPFVEPTRQSWQPPPAPSIPATDAPTTEASATTVAPRTTTTGTPRPPVSSSRVPSTATSAPTTPGRSPSSTPASPRTTAPPTTPSAAPSSTEPASPTVEPSGDVDTATAADG